jgi:hypothetical protein
MTERAGDDEWRLQAHHSGRATWVWAGDPAKARGHAKATAVTCTEKWKIVAAITSAGIVCPLKV